MTNATLLRASYACLTAGAAVALLTASVQTSPAPPRPARATGRTSLTGARPEPLFTQVVRTLPSPPSPMDKHTLRSAALTVSEKALAAEVVLNAEALLMNLFPDVQIVALRNRVESRLRGNYSWFGYIPGDPFGRAIITVVGGQLAAVVTPRGKRYLVLPAGDGTHQVREIDLRSFPENDDTTIDTVGQPRGGDSVFGQRSTRVAVGTPLDVDGLMRIFPWSFAKTNGEVPGMTFAPDPGEAVDIMVVYSHSAECTLRYFSPCSASNDPHDDPQAVPVFAQMAIDVTNQSFVDSHVDTRLNVIGDMWEVHDFQESGGLPIDHQTIRDGHVAGVHHQREERAADIVVLITHGPDKCGFMPILGNGAGEADAYAVVDVVCMLGGYVLAHEIGHGFGAAHDWESFDQETSAIVDLDAHGYISRKPGVTRALRTIMAKGRPCEKSGHVCEWIGRWSDPNATIDGYVLGVAGNASPKPAHDQAALNRHRETVANHRLSVCRFLDGC